MGCAVHRWHEQRDVTFVFGCDCTAPLHMLADDRPETAWKRLSRPPESTVKTKPRVRPEQVRQPIVEERGFARKITRHAVSDILHALRTVLYVRDSDDMPGWLKFAADRLPSFPATELVAVKNGLIHLPTVLAGTHSIIPHTPEFWSVNSLDVAFEPDGPDPIEWLKSLRSQWGNDQQSIDTLAEIFGYLISGETSQQKVFMLVGPPRSGKGTIATIITKIIGARNVIGPSLGSLDGPFTLQCFVGKTVAIVPEAHLSGRAEQVRIVEQIKSISGEGVVTVHRKNRDALSLCLRTRFLLTHDGKPLSRYSRFTRLGSTTTARRWTSSSATRGWWRRGLICSAKTTLATTSARWCSTRRGTSFP
jgi:phage/plasmid-associated DNA primase